MLHSSENKQAEERARETLEAAGVLESPETARLPLVERELPRTPDLSEIEAQVRTEWLRRAGDRALREYLDELRDQAEIVVAPKLP